MPPTAPEAVDLMKPADTMADIVATLLYPATDWPYRELYELASSWSPERRNEVIDVAMQSRSKRDELLRNFRTAPYVFDIVMDIGAYRDLHRHRRCQQFRQSYSYHLGYETPEAISAAGLSAKYLGYVTQANTVAASLPQPGAQYLLPFATRSQVSIQDGFRRSRIYRAPPFGSEGPLQLSPNCLGNEAKDEFPRT